MGLMGKCKVLRVYIDEDLKLHSKLLYKAMVDKLLDEKIAGVTVYRGVEGYGSSYHLHTPRIVEAMENLPMILEVIETPARALLALNIIEEMLPKHCLVSVQDIEILHNHAPDGVHTKTEKF